MTKHPYSDGRQLLRVQFMCQRKAELYQLLQSTGSITDFLNGLVNTVLDSPDPRMIIANTLVGRIQIETKTHDPRNTQTITDPATR